MAACRASAGVTCTVCGKTLSRRADLPRHMRTHADNKEAFMHRCEHPGCDYKSLQRSNLLTHMNTHTGKRPNKCPTLGCDYTTSDPGSLTRHRKTMHGYEPKAIPVVRPSNAARTAARRQRRVSPYGSSSSSSSSTLCSRASSTDPSYDVFDSTLSETAQMSDSSSPSPSPSDVKNAAPAYLTVLIPERPEPKPSAPPPARPPQRSDEQLAGNSMVDSSEEIQKILEYLQSQCPPSSSSIVPHAEEQPVYYIPEPSPAPCAAPAPAPAPWPYPVSLAALNLPSSVTQTDEDSGILCDLFLSQFADWNAAAAFFSSQTLPFPLYATQPAMSMDNTLYTYPYPSDAVLYNPQWSQPQPSYGMPVADFFEPVDWSYFEPAPASYEADSFFANEIFAC